MPAAGRMRLAMLDTHGTVIHEWDTPQLARQVLAHRVAQKAQARRLGIWPFRRTATSQPSMEDAITAAVDEFLLEIARL